jgi:hypothetical protein
VEENTKLKAKLQGGSIENIGARTATVDEMSTKTQRLLAAAGGPLMLGLMRKLSQPRWDAPPGSVLAVLLKRSTTLREEFEKAAAEPGGALTHPVCVQLKESIAVALRLGRPTLAQQLISVVTACMGDLGVTYADLEEGLSDLVELIPGERVKVKVKGEGEAKRAYRHGEVMEPGPDDAAGMVRVRMDPAAEDDGHAEHEAPPRDEIFIIPRDKVVAIMDVRVNPYRIQQSRLHAMSNFPGAPVVRETRTVQRISRRALLHYIDFCSGPEAVRILDASTHRSHFAERVDYRSELWVEYQNAQRLTMRFQWRSKSRGLFSMPTGRTR